MKLNLNVSLKTIDGLEMKEENVENGVKVLKPLMVNKICARIIYNSTEVDINDKLKAHNIALKLFNAEGDIDLELDEIVLIKSLLKNLSAGAYGQIINILEQKV